MEKKVKGNGFSLSPVSGIKKGTAWLKDVVESFIILMMFYMNSPVKAFAGGNQGNHGDGGVDKTPAFITRIFEIALSTVKYIYSNFYTIALIVAALYAAWAGVKLIISKGDPKKVSEVWRGLLYVVIGLIVVFGIGWIFSTADEISKTDGANKKTPWDKYMGN